MNQKGISSILIILIIVGVLVIGGGIYWWQSEGKLRKTEKCYKNLSSLGKSGTPSMPNPAAYFCTCMGGNLSAEKTPEGEKGLCQIEGRTYGQWEYFCEKNKDDNVYANCRSYQPKSQDQTADWKTYRNEEYRFEVKYPDYYQTLAPMKQFQERKSFDRSRSTKTLLSLEAISSEFVPGLSYRATYPKLEIHVFELNSYLFSNPIAGTEYDYDPVKDQWQQWQMYDILKAKNLGIPDLETLTGDGWVGYKLGYGDAGFGYAAVVIPLKDKNIMLEIVNISDALTGEFPLDTILSTFKFTK